MEDELALSQIARRPSGATTEQILKREIEPRGPVKRSIQLLEGSN
jgi:hypothetical protein